MNKQAHANVKYLCLQLLKLVNIYKACQYF